MLTRSEYASGFSRILPGHAMLFCPKLNSPAQTAGSLPDGCAMFIRKYKFHVLDAQVFYFNSLDPGKEKNSGGIVVGVKDKRNDEGLVFATTHLKAKDKAEFESIRNDQLSQLLQKVECMSHMTCGYTNATRVPIILTGDFNSPPGETCYKLMRSKLFESVYNTHCSLQSPEESSAVNEETYEGGEPSFTTMKVRDSLVRRTIDYIWVGLSSKISPFVSNATQIEEIGTESVNRDLLLQALYSLPSSEDIGPSGLPCAKYPSDHCSIAAKLAWSTSPTLT